MIIVDWVDQHKQKQTRVFRFRKDADRVINYLKIDSRITNIVVLSPKSKENKNGIR